MKYRYSRRRTNRMGKRRSVRRTKNSRRRTNNSHRRRSTKQRRRTVRPYRRRVRTRRNKRSKRSKRRVNRKVKSIKQYGGRNEYDVLCGKTVEFLPSSSIILSGPDVKTAYWQEMVSSDELGNYNIGKGYEPERIINGIERDKVNFDIVNEHRSERDELLSSIDKMPPISLDRFKDIVKMRLDVYTTQDKNIHHLGFWDNYIKGGMIDPDFSKVSIDYDEISVNVEPGFWPILDGKIIITEKKEEGLPLINVLKNIMYIDARIKELSKYVILENSRANNVRKPDSSEWYIKKVNSKFQEYKENKIPPPKIGKVYKDVDWFKVCCGLETYDEEFEKNVIKRLLPGDISGKETEEVKELKDEAMDKLKDDQEKIKGQIKVQELAIRELEENSIKETKEDLNGANIIDPDINKIDSASPTAKDDLRRELLDNINKLNQDLEKRVPDDITTQKADVPTPDPTKSLEEETVEPSPTPTPSPTPPLIEQPPTPLPKPSPPPTPSPTPIEQPPTPTPIEQPPTQEQQQKPPQMGGAMTSACTQILNEIQEGGKITETYLLRAISAQHGGNECFILPSS